MSPTFAMWRRFAALVSVVLWLTAFWFPAYLVPLKAMAGAERYPWSGLEVFIFGWIGPLGDVRILGWYANPFWFWNIWLMAQGRAPNPWAALLGAAIAATAYIPIDAQQLDDSAWGDAKAAFGVTVWVSSFVPALATAVIGLAWKIGHESHVKESGLGR